MQVGYQCHFVFVGKALVNRHVVIGADDVIHVVLPVTEHGNRQK